MGNIITSSNSQMKSVGAKIFGKDINGNVGFISAGTNINSDAAKIKYFRVIETFDSELGKTLTPSANTSADNTNKIFKQGYRSTLTYGGGAVEDEYIEVDLRRVVESSKPFIVPIYVHETNANSRIGLFFSNDSFSTGVFGQITVGSMPSGYYNLQIPHEFFSMMGNNYQHLAGPYAKLRVYVRQTTGTVGDKTDVTFLGVYQGLQKPQICLQFDDGLETVYTNAYPILQSLGLIGSVPAIGTLLGQTYSTYNVMSNAQIVALHSAGWEICVHGATNHTGLSTESAILADISSNKNILSSLGLVGALDLYVYPGGVIQTVDDASYNALDSSLMSYARINGTTPTTLLGENISQVFSSDKYYFPGYALSYNSFTPTEKVYDKLSSWIENGVSGIFFTHGVIDAAGVDAGREGIDITVAQLTEFCARLTAYSRAGMCDIVSWRDMLSTIPTSGMY